MSLVPVNTIMIINVVSFMMICCNITQYQFLDHPQLVSNRGNWKKKQKWTLNRKTIEVIDAKGRKQVIEAPVMVPATGEMIEDGGEVEL